MPTPSNQVVLELLREGFSVRTRADWGTRYESVYQKRRKEMRLALPLKYVFGHISVTFDDGVMTGDFDIDMRELERIGYERFGSGVSYTFTVDKDTGMIGVGQELDAKGTHTVNDKGVLGYPYNLNKFGMAIAWIGMPGQKLSAKAIASYAAIIRVTKQLNFLADSAYLLPHSMFAPKECPTDALRVRIPDIMELAGTATTRELELTVGQYEELMDNLIENRKFLIAISGNLASFMKREYGEDAAERVELQQIEDLLRKHTS